MSRAGPQVEIESKFDVPALFVLPSLDGIGPVSTVGAPVEMDLEATYFDTADLRLARGGIALRRRSGGTDEGWHLKMAQTFDERIEVHQPLGRAGGRVPARLADLVLARVHGRPLVPIATLRTHRTVRELRDHDGVVLAEVADDRVSGESGSAVSAWREVEIELVDGDRELLAAVGDRLRNAGAVPSPWASKLARLLDIHPGERSATPAGPDSTAGEAVLAHLSEQVGLLLAIDPLVRVDAADAVHKARVAARRLRSALATYRRLLDRSVTEPVRRELRWLGRVLGAERDAEVTREHLREAVAAQPRPLVIGQVARRIDRTLGAERRVAHRRVLAELRSERYLRLLDALESLAAGTALAGDRLDHPARTELPRAVRHAFRRMVRFVEEAAAASEPKDVDRLLHEVRKAAKRVRYAAESVAPVIGDDATELAKAMEDVQDVLGAHNDSVVIRPLLRRLAAEAEADGGSAFTFGRLHALEEWRAARTRERYEEMIGPLTTVPKWLR